MGGRGGSRTGEGKASTATTLKEPFGNCLWDSVYDRAAKTQGWSLIVFSMGCVYPYWGGGFEGGQARLVKAGWPWQQRWQFIFEPVCEIVCVTCWEGGVYNSFKITDVDLS